jgi:hypothetical protein
VSLPTLATVSDVTDRMFRELSEAEMVRVNSMLLDASAVVRNYTRQSFTSVRDTERLRPIGYRISLPRRPVVTVHSVKLIINNSPINAMGYIWDGLDEIYLANEGQIINLAETAYEWLATHHPVAEVDYTAGYDAVPDDVISVVCSMISRSLSAPGGGGIISEAVGEYTYRLSSAAAQGPLTLTEAEKDLLRAYRRQGSAIELRGG